MKVKIFTVVASLLLFQFSFAQNIDEYKSWKPAVDLLKDYYIPLTAEASNNTTEPIKLKAGVQLRFNTSADKIVVKFTVAKQPQTAEINETAFSGIDVFCKTINGKWLYTKGAYSSGDTVIYQFSNLDSKDAHVSNRQYYLYLPLYNVINWMEILVRKESFFKPLPMCKEQPVVVYETLAESRNSLVSPGFLTANILSRKLDRPVISISLPGDETAEKKCIELLAAADAKIFILDCLAVLIRHNLLNNKLKDSIGGIIKQLQIKKPGTPILLTENLFVNKKNKKINEALFSDGLHPNTTGYEKLGKFINRFLFEHNKG
jgi:hypothetical protein